MRYSGKINRKKKLKIFRINRKARKIYVYIAKKKLHLT